MDGTDYVELATELMWKRISYDKLMTLYTPQAMIDLRLIWHEALGRDRQDVAFFEDALAYREDAWLCAKRGAERHVRIEDAVNDYFLGMSAPDVMAAIQEGYYGK